MARSGYYLSLLLTALLLGVLLPNLSFGDRLTGLKDPDFGALTAKKGAKAMELFKNPTLYREVELNGLPITVGDFDFLLDRPRASVALAGSLHKSLDKYKITKTGPGTFHIDDTKQLVGDMELISSAPGRRLYYIDGYWRIIMGVVLYGRIAILTEYHQIPGGGIVAKAKGYMIVDNSAAGAALRVLVRLFPKTVDARIARFSTSVQKVVKGLHDDPAGTLKRLEYAKNVPPEEAREFRERFIKK